MEMKHLDSAGLARVRGGLASADEVEAVGRHVTECAECATLAMRALSVVESVEAFDAAFTVERRHSSRRRFSGLKVAAPLAAAAAIGAVVFFMPRAEETRPPLPQPRTTTVVAPPVTVHRAHPLLEATRTSGVLPFPAEIRALAEGDTFRGDPQGAARDRVSPAATTIDDARPELRWPATEGARYIVTIMSEGEEVAQSEPLTQPRWRTALQRGRTYRWQVSIERDGESRVIPAPPAPPAIFRVLSQREHDELSRDKKAAGGNRLLLGLLYARAGMREEARRELETYERETRDPLAGRLLRQLP